MIPERIIFVSRGITVLRNAQLQALETHKFTETQVQKETEMSTFFTNETNLRNRPHINVQVANETTVATVESSSEISIVN